MYFSCLVSQVLGLQAWAPIPSFQWPVFKHLSCSSLSKQGFLKCIDPPTKAEEAKAQGEECFPSKQQV